MIKFVKGDATNPCEESGIRVIAHVCNDIGMFGSGFAACVAKRWGFVRDRYIAWSVSPKEKGFLPGAIQVVRVGDGIYIANMIAQNGVRSASNQRPINYPALGQCLQRLDDWITSFIKVKDAMMLPGLCPEVTVHMPRIGCGLAGGDWNVVEPLVDTFINRVTYVYDLEE
jgi:hypothetical protein